MNSKLRIPLCWKAGDRGQAEALLRHLDRYLDLRRLTRNPFLLTLLCGIGREAQRREGLDLPATRADLYEQTIRLIYAHHDERYPEVPLGSDRQRQIERLALWLLDEAPGAPRFVFGPEDVVASGGEPDLLPRYLKPSRLLGRLGPDDNTHHFLHATFQEYLAAGALEREAAGRAIQRLRVHVHDATWQEVYHFLAAHPGPLRDAFWREMSTLAARPDRFGIVLARLARWVAAAGAVDGGVGLLGRDLRDLLWPFIERITASRIWVEAYAELDAAGFVRRAEEAIQTADPRLQARLQRTLTRVRNPAASRALVDQILGEDDQKAAVAATQLHVRIDSEGRNRLRETAGDPGRSIAIRRQAVRALGYARDHRSLILLPRIAREEPSLAAEVASALGRIGGVEATGELVAMLEHLDETLPRSVVRALGEMRDVPARDALLDEIARRPVDDPLIVPILDALAEIPIHRGVELIVDLLASEAPEVRRAAAWALAEASGPGVFEGLVAAANDPDEEVRCAALEVFQDRAQPDDAGWLVTRIGDSSRSSDERGFALRALLAAAGRYAHTPEESWLPGVAVEQVLLALRDPEGDLALEAAAHAHHAGPSVGPRLVELCLDAEASPGARELACTALGKMQYRGAVDALLELVRAVPDADDDEDQPLEADTQRVARAAAEALTRIDAGLLLREPGSTVFFALARFAVETGCLIYDDYIMGPDGRVGARITAPSAALLPVPPESLAMEPSTVPPPDLEIHVRIEPTEGKKILIYTLHSASGRAGFNFQEVRGPELSLAPEIFAHQFFDQIEKLHEGFDVEGNQLLLSEAAKELESLGQGLYRSLFQGEMEAFYRRFRKIVHTVQITSTEAAIPWELVKPYDDSDRTDLIDDDFLCMRFQLTRWLAGPATPRPLFAARRLACLGGSVTRSQESSTERQMLADLTRRHPGLEDASPSGATFADVEGLLQRGGIDLFHFMGHGDFVEGMPSESKIVLSDRPFRARNLSGRIQTQMRDDRPFVVFNACRVARQGWSLAGLEGWAQAWVRVCQCGAFLGPLWLVKNSAAYEFACVLYGELENGKTLGEAALAARHAVRKLDAGRPNSLAFAVYGHPNARVSFGIKTAEPPCPSIRLEQTSPAPGPPQSRQAPTPGPTSAPSAPEIFEDRRIRGESAPFVAASRLPLPPPSFLGRAADLRFLKAGLGRFPGEKAERGPLLIVTGWPGVGKTTMTTALANDPELREAFPDGILWASLDQSPSLRTELSSWCIALGSPGPSPVATLEETSFQLGHLLRRRRVLLLLDDVWEAAHAVPFLVGGPGCAMLATSRLDAVAEQLAPTSGAVYRLPLLSEEAGLELLRSRAPEVVAAYTEDCRVLVRELEGLPLSLHVAGRMLAQDNRLWSPAELLQTLRAGRQLLEQSAPIDRTDLRSQTLPTLSILLAKSTERLPPELLERFAFLGVFAPKPATFDLAALRAVWGVEDPKPSVRALVNLGLLEAVGDGSFRMHALLVAHARSLLEE